MMHWLMEKLGLKTCPGCQTLVDFAMDGLPEGQQEKVRRHLDQCPPCREQVRDFWQVREGLGLCAQQAEAPRDLCSKVLARLQQDACQGVDRAMPSPFSGGWPRFWMIFGPAFAVLGLVMTLVAFVSVLDKKRMSAPAQGDALASLLASITEDPRSAHVVLSAAGDVKNAAGLLVLCPGLDHAILRCEHLPPDPVGGAYVLWIKTPTSDLRPLAYFTVGDGASGGLQLLQLKEAFTAAGPVEFRVAQRGAGSAPGEAVLKGSAGL